MSFGRQLALPSMLDWRYKNAHTLLGIAPFFGEFVAPGPGYAYCTQRAAYRANGSWVDVSMGALSSVLPGVKDNLFEIAIASPHHYPKTNSCAHGVAPFPLLHN